MFEHLNTAIRRRRALFRHLYHANSELLQLALKRFSAASVNNRHKVRAKLLNLLVNSYALKEYKRTYGFSFSSSLFKPRSETVLPAKEAVKVDSFAEKFDHLLPAAAVVTFDIFDTLLVRKTAVPTDVFRLIEATNPNYAGFADERISSERRARHLVNDEILLDDIYDTISPKFRHLKEKELAVEARALLRNAPIFELYQKAVAAGKRVAVISDMYLPASFLKSVLAREGYTQIEAIFVSGELRQSKCVEGHLFVHAANSMGVSTSQLLHVGDNRHSDYDMPLKVGAQAVHIPMLRELFLTHPDARFCMRNDAWLSHSVHNALVMHYDGNGSYFRKLGFMLGGPLALGYLTWIDKEIRLSKADCVLFVARDGWLLRQLYERYFNKDARRTGYVYFNRILGLKAFATYLDEPHYLAILLRRAHKYLGTPEPTKDFETNLKIFRQVRSQLKDWGAELKEELTAHANAEAAGARRIVTVDMGSGRFASLSFARRIFGERLINSYFWMTVNNNHKAAVYQPYLPYVATSRDILVSNDSIEGGDVNIMELMEILISSPEPRIIDIKDGKPVYDGHNDQKAFYGEIADGIDAYIRAFFDFVSPNNVNTVIADDWLHYARAFVQHLTEEDFSNLSCIDFCAAADNETNAHRPFKPSVKRK